MAGLPKIRVIFENAAQDILTRAKKGTVGVLVRDTKAQGVYTITDESQIPSSLGEANRAYAARALMGTKLGRPTKLVLVVFAPAENEETGTEGLTAAMTLLNGQMVDYLAGHPDMTEAEMEAVKDFVLAYRRSNPTLQVVLPGCAADDRGVINYTSTVHVAEQVFGPAAYCSRIAGALAGLPTTASCTNLELEEVTAVESIAEDDQTEEEAQEAAIAAGELIVVHDGLSARIARGVNSYVNTKSGERENLKKIKVTEGEGLLHYYTVRAIREGYMGRVVNSYDNRCLLVVELQTMYDKMEGQGILLPGSSSVEIDVEAQRAYMEDNGVDCSKMDDDQIRQYENLGDHVFLAAHGAFADTMEDFDIRVTRM